MRLLSCFFLLLMLSVAGCKSPDPIDDIFGWPESGDRTADSLMIEFERARTGLSTSIPRDAGKKLQAHARTSRNPLVRFRAQYTLLCNYCDNNSIEEIMQQMAKTESMIDSASYPYDWHMFLSIKSDFEPDALRKYYLLTDNLKYFRQTGELSEVPRILNNLGTLMCELNDSTQARKYYRECALLCKKFGFKGYYYTSVMNEASVAPLKERVAMLRSLMNDPEVKSNPRLLSIIYPNYFADTDSILYLERAIDILESTNIDVGVTPLVYAMKGDYMSRSGEYAQGLDMINKGVSKIVVGETQPPCIPLIYRMRAEAYERIGQADSAASSWRKSLEWTERQEKKSDRGAIYNDLIQSQVKLAERNANLEMERQWLIGGLLLLFLSGAGYAVYYIMRRRKKILVGRLLRTRQAMLAQTSVLEEHKSLIASIAEHVEQKSDDMGAAEVARLLRLHRSNDDNRNSILDVQQNINPNFLVRLKQDFPSLTENQLRIASLIVAGADSRAIGSILNITQPSVHTSRYRLRTKLGLSRNDSLEAFLREYNRKA